MAKDNVAYQDLFGGQIMIVLFTMDEGHTVDELATPRTRGARGGQGRARGEPARAHRGVADRRPPVQPEPPAADAGRPHRGHGDLRPRHGHQSIASQAVSWATATDQEAGPAALRADDFATTVDRLLPFADEPGAPNDGRTLDNADWVDVLLYGNDGEIRKPLLSSFFDDTHAR
ncbi:MAG: hypothetical protein R2711_08200 [Acidimicrobiales bacterium]